MIKYINVLQSTVVKKVKLFLEYLVAFRKAVGKRFLADVYLELVYLVTALVPSETACLANSPGRIRRTAV